MGNFSLKNGHFTLLDAIISISENLKKVKRLNFDSKNRLCLSVEPISWLRVQSFYAALPFKNLTLYSSRFSLSISKSSALFCNGEIHVLLPFLSRSEE